MSAFLELGLKPEINQALEELGFKEPTPIQAQSIPQLLSSQQDLIALAQTGTGKTAAFSLPIIQQIDAQARDLQAIILCPTRELCLQVHDDIKTFSKHSAHIRMTAIYGGDPIGKQINSLKQKPQIVIGTPGRVHDMLRRRALDLENIRWVVLDEADEMLKMGFKEELDVILGATPKERQTVLFSATMPSEIQRIAKQYMHNAMQISTGKANTSAENIAHQFYVVHAADKYKALRRIADSTPDIYGIVFCRTREETKDVANRLMADHYPAEAIHGDLSQKQREDTMQRFRKQQVQLLVATDVAARGIDVTDLTHVINYSLPENSETYIHRIGRTGRAGKTGTAISIINMREHSQIHRIQKRVGKQFQQKQIPNGNEICQIQLMHLINKIQTTEYNTSQIEKYLPVIQEQLAELSREELVKRFVATEFNRFLEFYQNAPDLNQGVNRGGSNQQYGSHGGRSDRFGRSDRQERSGGRQYGGSVQFDKFSINIGNDNNFRARDLFDFINSQPGLKGLEIGQIEIQKDFTTFEADQSRSDKILGSFNNLTSANGNIHIKKIGSGGSSAARPHSGGRSSQGGYGQRRPRRDSSRDSSSRGGYRGKRR